MGKHRSKSVQCNRTITRSTRAGPHKRVCESRWNSAFDRECSPNAYSAGCRGQADTPGQAAASGVMQREEVKMPDDKTKTGGQDRKRINVHEEYELRDWSTKF